MLADRVTELAQGKTFAAVSTLLPDGSPMTKILWVDADDEHLLLNTEVHRQGYLNVQRDPRVTVTLIDPKSPYRFAEVRGQVVETVTGPDARDHIDQLARKYTGGDYTGSIQSERVILKIAPRHQVVRAPGG